MSDRYLGMPTDVGHSKMGTFKYLSDRVWDKVKGWMGKCLSAGGKEVLIKSVAQAIRSTPCPVSSSLEVYARI